MKIFLRLPVSIDLCDESSQSLKSTIQDNLTFLCLLKSQDWHVVFDFASLHSRFKASGSELMRPSPDVLKLLIRGRKTGLHEFIIEILYAVFSSSADMTRLTYRCTMQAQLESKWIQLLNAFLAQPFN